MRMCVCECVCVHCSFPTLCKLWAILAACPHDPFTAARRARTAGEHPVLPNSSHLNSKLAKWPLNQPPPPPSSSPSPSPVSSWDADIYVVGRRYCSAGFNGAPRPWTCLCVTFEIDCHVCPHMCNCIYSLNPCVISASWAGFVCLNLVKRK